MRHSTIDTTKDCTELMNTTDDDVLPPGAFSLNASSLHGRRRSTNNDIWAMADHLHDLATHGRATGDQMKFYGLTYNPLGLLWDMDLRHTHLPLDHYIRDWMHILVSGGVANAEVHGLVKAMKDEGLPLKLLGDFSVEIVLPSKYGKVSPTWLAPGRFDDKGRELHSFASYLLTLLPIIGIFLQDIVQPHGILQDHIECFLKLVSIVGLLSSGAEYAVQHMGLLAETIVDHHRLFVRLYPNHVKTKFHQVLHLPELYIRMQKVISCFVAFSCPMLCLFVITSSKFLFSNTRISQDLHKLFKVTERKHRSVKSAALYVFRNLEHTSLASILNMQCEQALAGHCLFQKEFLVHPSDMVICDTVVSRSTSIVLECGELARSDVVYIKGGQVARVQCFLELNSCFTMQCIVCNRVSSNTFIDGSNVSFVSCSDVVDAMSYRPLGDGSFRVIWPFKARFM